ncbi:pilus assembly FimT family protein [Roseiconus nitratireducens]|nr:prepilin-type N-terminal cleavage/methylation domain-containing protein [Roseiconus nitratireducens]
MTLHRRSCRDAFTLVELLIALTIASALTAIALPTLKDSMRQNTLSRSASLVKGAFINARAQAIRTGRPYGIVIERQRHDIGSGNPSALNYLGGNYATRLYYVQSPLEYRGDVAASAVYPVFDPPTGSTPVPKFFFPQTSAGLLYAVANSSGTSPAARLINVGTQFSVGKSDYIFKVESAVTYTVTGGSPLNAQGVPAGPGTLVEFNYPHFSPQNTGFPGTLTTTGVSSTFPAGLAVYQPHDFKFRVNPVRAPLAPVSLIGRTVVDLSVSGPSSNPLAFNVQQIVDPIPTTQIPNLAANRLLNDVYVMFAPDGRLDGIYSDQRIVNGGVIDGFNLVRLDPSTTVSFNVGYVDGILDNIDDGARYPDVVGTTDYNITTDDPPLATPAPPAALTPTKVPNFANTDCAWVSVQPLSGAIRLDTVASQPPATVLTNYYGLGTTPPARSVMNARVHQSRRLASGGAVQ